MRLSVLVAAAVAAAAGGAEARGNPSWVLPLAPAAYGGPGVINPYSNVNPLNPMAAQMQQQAAAGAQGGGGGGVAPLQAGAGEMQGAPQTHMGPAFTSGGVAFLEEGEALQPPKQPVVSETDPSKYRPERVKLDAEGRPVYPLPRSVPQYPNKLQLDREGRPLYPDPDAAATSSSFVEREGEALQPPKQPVVSETDPSKYRPERVKLDAEGRPVYPLPRSVPQYPNKLQLDREGRPLYPDPDAAATSSSFVEAAGATNGRNPSFYWPQGADRTIYALPVYLGARVKNYVPPASVLEHPTSTFTPPLGVLPSAKPLPFELRNTNLFVRPGMTEPVGLFTLLEEGASARAAARGSPHVFSASQCTNCEFVPGNDV